MSKRSDKLLIEDIIESIDKILVYTNDMTYQDFLNDVKTMDATIRNF